MIGWSATSRFEAQAAIHSLTQNQARTGIDHFGRFHSMPSMLVRIGLPARRSQGRKAPPL
ncbi:hypothetical protein AOPFMNJM_1475 [Methylobacterium jeotgali]|uniref:Uncharacterized protein n=1 Tax=Methylobacterium jeotgali TaxID=381630 RepID=A0ABQ4SST6_9HYPH|nr:hypothetical protein AOPFMNJM_1475 [Methylobacterium jeotgali]